MRILGFINFVFIQWFFIRLAEIKCSITNKHLGWTLLKGVIPLTGWWNNYWYLKKGKKEE
jgi:hypothetical protein